MIRRTFPVLVESEDDRHASKDSMRSALKLTPSLQEKHPIRESVVQHPERDSVSQRNGSGGVFRFLGVGFLSYLPAPRMVGGIRSTHMARAEEHSTRNNAGKMAEAR